MPSLTEPRRCARGPRCKGFDPDKNLSAKLPRYTEGAFCGQCRENHRGWYRTSDNDRWMDKVTGAIEKVFAQRPTPQRPHKATLWDLFGLDTLNGGWKKFHDRGAALGRLDAKTLATLRDFLEEHEEEAINRHGALEYEDLRAAVGVDASLASLPPDKPLLGQEGDALGPSDTVIHTSRGHVVNVGALDNAIPFDGAAYYTRSGRTESTKTPLLVAILAEALRQRYPGASKRAIEDTIEEVLGVPRSRQKRWHNRMEEVGMTWRSFTGGQLQYVALGGKRGAKRKP